MQVVLDYCMLGRGIYELRYGLLNHPERMQIPLKAILHLLHERDRRQPEPERALDQREPAAEADNRLAEGVAK
jgi:hypothetical protein